MLRARALLAALLIAATCVPARADISFETETGNQPDVFGSGMVLQRRATVPVWGRSDAGVQVRADFVDPSAMPGSEVLQTRSTTSTSGGRWVVRFDNLPVGGPYELRFFEGA